MTDLSAVPVHMAAFEALMLAEPAHKVAVTLSLQGAWQAAFTAEELQIIRDMEAQFRQS